MINTWIAATIVAAVAGCVGFFVVVRGSSFAAHALPLGMFPGAALANLMGIDQLFGLGLFALLGVAGISQLGREDRHEVATALSLVMLLGLGALFLSMSTAYSQEVYALLFGEVLGVGSGDLLPIAGIGAVTIMLTIMLFRPLMLSSVSPELGEARGVRHHRVELAFLAIVALSTTVAVPVVGVLLVFSLMVGPASLARALTDRPLRAMALSALVAVVIAWLAIALSFASDWPVGFFVGMLGAVAYGCGRVWSRTHARLVITRRHPSLREEQRSSPQNVGTSLTPTL